MKISLITPAPKQSRAGNQVTARRWARLLRELGHEVRVARDYRDEPADLMIALHAWRSAASIERFRAQHPAAPLVVALTGTDIYRYAKSDAATTFRSLDLADALVGLHDLVRDALPPEHRGKLVVIHQSATALARRPPLRRVFEVLIIGHLREEKDPLRAAAAARLLPPSSRIRIVHFGGAHDREWALKARREMTENPRYRWLGNVSGHAVRRALARAPLMVLSSIMEGGANVVSEAVVAGVPVLASAIPGSIGLLGRDYPGYFPIGDTAALARLLRRAEEEPAFRAALERHCAKRARLFAPERERQAWRGLLARLVPARRAAEA
ncbi:MAG TPA: selenoneine biosynthesis selenosugar synthase SenB [Stellaceae bacterium]|nr:selenoneine biosynthesis selenosugar synthase SenB [Stellaceae bacterium]